MSAPRTLSRHDADIRIDVQVAAGQRLAVQVLHAPAGRPLGSVLAMHRFDVVNADARTKFVDTLPESFRVTAATLLHALAADVAAELAAGAPPKSGEQGEDHVQGHEVHYEEVAPAGEPVDGKRLLDALVADAQRFIVAPHAAFVAIGLWVMHTYTMEACDITPRLAITSPCPGCGKSRLLDWLGTVVRRPDACAHCTTAAMFRVIELHQPTLLVDEADTFFRDNEQLRGLVNSGFARNGTFRLTVGDDHEPRAFRTFAAKAIAGIGELPRTIVERSIPIEMQKKMRDETRERLRVRKLTAGNLPFRRQLARWAEDNVDALRDVEPDFPEGLTDRQCDLWEPLFVIADRVGGPWSTRAREAAIVLSGVANERTAGHGEWLLSDIRDLCRRVGKDLPTDTILKHLLELADRPWPTWYRGKPIDARALGKLLGGYHVTSKTVHGAGPGGKDVKGYRRADLENAFRRYLQASGCVQPSKPLHDSDLQGSADVWAGEMQTVPNVLREKGMDPWTDGTSITVAAADSDELLEGVI